jgi:hypothetical protein
VESSHISALLNKHASIERRIRDEMSRPKPNVGMVQALKRHKLRIRDEIAHH